MIPLRSDVNLLVRSLLGDTSVSGGELYVDAFIPPYLNQAYQEIFAQMDLRGLARVQAQNFYVLPAYTGVLAPATAGLTNFGSPAAISERGSVTTYRVSGATPGSGICTLTLTDALPSSVVTGNAIEVGSVGGLTDDVNGSWTIAVNSTTSIVLSGCAATGTYTSGGTVAVSTEQWSNPLVPKDSVDAFPTSPVAALSMYSWQRGLLRFPACSTARELKIEYQLSSSLNSASNASTSESMGIDDSLAFLANRTGQYCAASKGSPKDEQSLRAAADYFMNLLLSKMTRDAQAGEPIVPARFRNKRTSNSIY